MEKDKHIIWAITIIILSMIVCITLFFIVMVAPNKITIEFKTNMDNNTLEAYKILNSTLPVYSQDIGDKQGYYYNIDDIEKTKLPEPNKNADRNRIAKH